MSANLPPSLKEEKSHGSQSFRCGYYLSSSEENSFQVPLHWHEELEIIYFQKGHFILEVNMEQYQIDSECFFFINSGELHRILCNEPCEESAVVFSPYLLSFMSNDAAQTRLILPLIRQELLFPRRITPRQSCYSDVLFEYRKLTRHCNEDPSLPYSALQQLFIKTSLLNILGCLSGDGILLAAKEPRNANIESIKSVLSYIHTHYSEKIFVGDLARLINLNEQYFCRFFKKTVGQSPIAYVNEYRIRRAIELLTDTSAPVTDICLECGFNNFGNFLREFKKQTGTTPGQYKKGIRRKITR